MKNIYKSSAILLLVILFTLPVHAQWPWALTGNSIVPTNYLGTNNNRRLDLRTNATERMLIQNNNGFVGIGTNYFTPNNLLDVNRGDINVVTAPRGYRLNNNYILRHKGNVNDVFIGVNAGLNILPIAQNNFIAGYNSGANGASNSLNEDVFIGVESGFQAQGNISVYVGYRAGYTGGGSGINTFIGAEAGFLDFAGDENVFVGWRSGYNCANGVHNSFLGNLSGFNNDGSNNTFIGITSGINNMTGTGNTSLGAGAGPGPSNLTNAAAISAGAQVMQNNQLIIGNSTQNSGIGLSGDPIGPQNLLEINTPATSAVPGFSGLRLRDMTTFSTAVNNPGTGVLTVDANGDVIYANPNPPAAISNAHNALTNSTLSAGFAAFGQNMGQLGNPGNLLNDREIPTSNFNIQFTDPVLKIPGQNLVSFGNSYAGNPLGAPKVYSENRSEPVSITGATDAGSVSGFLPAVGNMGVSGETINSNWTYSTGVYGLSRPNLNMSGDWSYGVLGETKLNANDIAMAIGVAGNTDSPGNGVINCGGWFTGSNAVCTAPCSAVNYGIYAWTPNWQTGYAVFSDGDLWVNGNGTATGILTWSDKNLKRDISTIHDGLGIIQALSPSTYTMDTQNTSGLRFSNKKQYGFIAQDVQKVLPDIVHETDARAGSIHEGQALGTENTLLSMNYTELLPFLIKGMQEQQAIIDELNTQLNDLTLQIQDAGLLPETGN
jgi:hypothetical protein